MNAIVVAPTRTRPRLVPRPRAYARFEHARQRMLRDFRDWIVEDRPPSDLIAAEAAATASAVTQIGALLAGRTE